LVGKIKVRRTEGGYEDFNALVGAEVRQFAEQALIAIPKE